MDDNLKERVKALAVEAGAAFDPGFESVGPNPMWIMSPSDLLRFAQAVARDCAAVCDNAWQIDGSFSAKEFGDLVRARYGLEGR